MDGLRVRTCSIWRRLNSSRMCSSVANSDSGRGLAAGDLGEDVDDAEEGLPAVAVEAEDEGAGDALVAGAAEVCSAAGAFVGAIEGAAEGAAEGAFVVDDGAADTDCSEDGDGAICAADEEGVSWGFCNRQRSNKRIVPPGRTMRVSSRSAATGSGTAHRVYVLTAVSKVSSRSGKAA